MKIDINGIIRNMTPEEIKELEQMQTAVPPPPPSLEETVQQQAQEIEDLKAVLNALLEKRVQ